MVHVEIYDPTDENPRRCFGSRWNDGVVQHFDDYEFRAQSWQLLRITFCSIDTWLDGVCESVCAEHAWELPEISAPNQRSIFYSQEDQAAD